MDIDDCKKLQRRQMISELDVECHATSIPKSKIYTDPWRVKTTEYG